MSVAQPCPSPTVDGLVEFLQQRRFDGDDGKTFLIGYAAAQAAFAVAARLRGDGDHPGFLTFGCYLLTHRFQCDAYGLLLPAEIDSVPIYVIEQCRLGHAPHQVYAIAEDVQAVALSGALIGDLLRPIGGLPGLLRRELDRRFLALEIALAGHGDG